MVNTKSTDPNVMIAQLEDVLRSMPPSGEIMHGIAAEWMGRARAAMNAACGGNPHRMLLAVQFSSECDAAVRSSHLGLAEDNISQMRVLLHQAMHELRLEAMDPASVVVGESMTFAYFEEIRKKVEQAKSDLLFVDPYLDADFVSSYLPYVSSGVSVRLLTSKQRIKTLIPSVSQFVKQNGTQVEVRLGDKIHDRFLFVDGAECYQSGASFKDGAKKAVTTISQILDAFPAMQSTYEQIWQSAESAQLS